jgi:hypothetical protein
MVVGKNILEVTEEEGLRWFGHVKRMPRNRLPRRILEGEPEGTRRKGRPKERRMDEVRRSSVTIHGLTEQNTRARVTWRNFFFCACVTFSLDCLIPLQPLLLF